MKGRKVGVRREEDVQTGVRSGRGGGEGSACEARLVGRAPELLVPGDVRLVRVGVEGWG